MPNVPTTNGRPGSRPGQPGRNAIDPGHAKNADQLLVVFVQRATGRVVEPGQKFLLNMEPKYPHRVSLSDIARVPFFSLYQVDSQTHATRHRTRATRPVFINRRRKSRCQRGFASGSIDCGITDRLLDPSRPVIHPSFAGINAEGHIGLGVPDDVFGDARWTLCRFEHM